MADFESLDLNDPVPAPQTAGTHHPRAVGSPLPMGTGPARALQPQLESASRRPAPAPLPSRSLPNPPLSAPEQPFANIQRAVNALRLALPFVQRLLPILDGQVISAVSGILTRHSPPQPAPPSVNLAPIEDGLAELQAQHRELRDQVVEQNSSLKHVEDQLEMVREATDRNTLEQQELMEDLKSVGKKVKILALIAFGLLALSILLNVILYLQILRVLP